MARRQLLTDEERTALLGIPADSDSLARLFTPSRADRVLVAQRRSDANRPGCAVQLALLRHPGTALVFLNQSVDALVAWMAAAGCLRGRLDHRGHIGHGRHAQTQDGSGHTRQRQQPGCLDGSLVLPSEP